MGFTQSSANTNRVGLFRKLATDSSLVACVPPVCLCVLQFQFQFVYSQHVYY